MKGIGQREKEDKEKKERKQRVEKVVGRRLERHPADGLPLKHDPKKGHGGKFSWEGPYGLESESEHVPAAMDENDPNYVDVDDDVDDSNNRGQKKDEVSGGLVIGEVETPAVAATGVARIEVDPSALQKSF